MAYMCECKEVLLVPTIMSIFKFIPYTFVCCNVVPIVSKLMGKEINSLSLRTVNSVSPKTLCYKFCYKF